MSETRINDYTQYLSKRGSRLNANPLRRLLKLSRELPDSINLGNGQPNPHMIPFASLNFSLTSGEVITLPPAELSYAMQYSISSGHPELLSAIKKIQTKYHNPLGNDWEVTVTSGSQEAIQKLLDIFLDEEDTIITENPSYVGFLAAMRPHKSRFLPIDIDKDGMIPDKLSQALLNWKSTNPNQKPPNLLYCVPTGQNPSGCTYSLARRKEIYKIAQTHNLIIIEDDPYYHLKILPLNESTQSFLSLDIDGRVIRLDSFSKIISPGIRLGWVTGPNKILEILQWHNETAAFHSSGVSQILVTKLLEQWGEEGFANQIKIIQEFYTKQRNTLLRSCERHLTGLAEWYPPSAGMFIWVKLNGVEDTDYLLHNATTTKVLLAPGKYFSPNGGKSSYVRISYSLATEEEMDEAMRRIACLLKSK
eukprot:TRINITY_DN1083_c0_g1_i1.p1 TRINITY_DN1083_c0_g1~~TRINITY_DN1083_c0_g1_i1.p1  ORF type:complete len:420 (+),score=51.15 TRINITY_DN1083_c0_g1_i1:86-1345(+)